MAKLERRDYTFADVAIGAAYSAFALMSDPADYLWLFFFLSGVTGFAIGRWWAVLLVLPITGRILAHPNDPELPNIALLLIYVPMTAVCLAAGVGIRKLIARGTTRPG